MIGQHVKGVKYSPSMEEQMNVGKYQFLSSNFLEIKTMVGKLRGRGRRKINGEIRWNWFEGKKKGILYLLTRDAVGPLTGTHDSHALVAYGPHGRGKATGVAVSAEDRRWSLATCLEWDGGSLPSTAAVAPAAATVVRPSALSPRDRFLYPHWKRTFSGLALLTASASEEET